MSIGLALVVIAILFLLFSNPTFRKFAAVALGLAVIAGLLLGLWLWYDNRANARRLEQAKGYIKVSDIEIVDPRLSYSTFDHRPNEIMGRVRNNSHYGLERLEVRLVFQNCPSSGACETVGEAKDEIYFSAVVPPGQSRDFKDYVSGPAMSPKGRLDWHYEILSISAELPQ